MNPQEVVRTPLDEAVPSSASVDAEEVLNLPPDSPDRRAFLSEQILAAADAINRGDLDAYVSGFDPDVEIRIARLEDGGVWGGDFDEVYRGSDGARRLLEQWLEPWDQIRLEPHEILDAGGDNFVAIGEWVGTGRSGVEVRTPWPARFTIRGAVVTRVDFFHSSRAALETMGIHPRG